VVLLQYAIDDGDIILYNVWKEPINETLELIETITLHEEGICGFNLTFDWFHICQLYTTLSVLKERVGGDSFPEDHIDEYALCEPEARDGPCLKPVTALDLMLYARKGPYQSTMDRGDIRIKRIPTLLAEPLMHELDRLIPLKDIYFAKRKNKKRWQIFDIEDDLGEINPNFKDIVLKFAPTSALKALAVDALGIDESEVIKFDDIAISDVFRPEELGYAPFALAIGKPGPGEWNKAWPEVIHYHIRFWRHNDIAKQYAEKDVEYLRRLKAYFGNPPAGDDDSILACSVGAIRWHGFKIDKPKIEALRKEAEEYLSSIEFNFNSVDVVRRYLYEVLDEASKSVIAESTKKIILEDLAKWTLDETCKECEGQRNSCVTCGGDGLIAGDKPHPVAARAALILKARRTKKRIEVFNKLLHAGRFHADFNVIGALSSRMSGAGGLNAQGINKEEEVRECFILAFEEMILLGGDFDGFEVVLIDAAYGDPELREELLSGRKIHAIFGTFLFPGKSYEDILATKKLPEGENLYSRSKNGVFAMAYGGEAYTLMHRVGISEAAANEAYQRFMKRYKVFGEKRKRIFDMFCSMRQPGGLGSKVEWHDPSDYIESLYGFRRYFTLENRIVMVLFQIAENPPKEWTALKIKVVRRDRSQDIGNAVRSALFGCAFQVQAANMRAAGNHVIQSSGATLCKALQRSIWDIQDPGVTIWRVLPMNIHDEILAPTHPSYIERVFEVQKNFIIQHREKVPLLEMEFARMESWGAKG
jgi:hypothetical protein